MKKSFRILKSMEFGLVLLGIISFLSFFGSILAQGNVPEYYIQTYPKWGRIILALQFDDIFSSWYFIFIGALLCINLTLCSITRLNRIRHIKTQVLKTAERCSLNNEMNEIQKARLSDYFISNRYKILQLEERTIYYKNTIGYVGSCMTHLSLLMILVFGSCIFAFTSLTDVMIYPNESYQLKNSDSLYINEFHIEDESGKLDYKSYVSILDKNNEVVKSGEISVNHPLTYREYKFYQQTYMTVGELTVTNTITNQSENIILDEVFMLSADGVNGIWYKALYPDMITVDNETTLISSVTGSYPNPVYEILVQENGKSTPTLVKPDEVLLIDDLLFRFNEPIEVPGIRVKYVSPIYLGCLYASFLSILISLYICFFKVPVVVILGNDKYGILGEKTTGIKIQIETLLMEE